MSALNLIQESFSRKVARDHWLYYGEPYIYLSRDRFHALGRILQVRGVRGAESYVRDPRSPLVWPGLTETVHAALYLLAQLPLPGTDSRQTTPPRDTPLEELLAWTEHRTQDDTPLREVATRLVAHARRLLDPEQTPEGSLRNRRRSADEVLALLSDLAPVAAATLISTGGHVCEGCVRDTIASLVGHPQGILASYDPGRAATHPHQDAP